MKQTIRVMCYAAVISAAMSVCAADGAASKTELQQLYQRYFQQKDEQRLAMLVYWQGVEQRDRDGFLRSLRNDLKYRLKKVELVPLDAGVKLEYTLEGVTYVPALPAIGRMIVSYEDQGNVKHLSTSYLIGVKDRRYYIDLATQKRSN
jgi:hypothetical protein